VQVVRQQEQDLMAAQVVAAKVLVAFLMLAVLAIRHLQVHLRVTMEELDLLALHTELLVQEVVQALLVVMLLLLTVGMAGMGLLQLSAVHP
jgi:hypothetical protein